MAFRDDLKKYRETQGKQTITSTTPGSSGSGGSGSSFRDWLKEYREVAPTISLDGWAETSINLINDVRLGSDSWYDDNEYQSRYDRFTSLIGQADSWRKQYAGNQEAVSYIDSVVSALSEAQRYSFNHHKFYSNWENQEDYNFWDAHSTLEKRQQWYADSQKRLEELNAERKNAGFGRRKDIDAEIDSIESEMRLYERGGYNERGQYYGSKVVDDYQAITKRPDFDVTSANRNYDNPTRGELNKYDAMNDTSRWYFDASGVYRDALGNELQADQKSGTWVNPYAQEYAVTDRLGMFLNASEQELKEAMSTPVDMEGTWETVLKDGMDKGWDQLDETEIAIYYALRDDSQESADKYLEDMTTELTRRKTEKDIQQLTDQFNEANVLEKIALSVATTPAQLFSGVAGTIENTANILMGNEINPYSRANQGMHFSQTVRGLQAAELNEATDIAIPVINFSVGDAYQAGMSILDSYTAIGIGGKLGSALLATTAATSEATRLYEQGASMEQVAVGSAAAGAAEWIFESLSVGNLIKIKNSKTVWQAIKNVLVQGGIEASEEGFTEIANILTNAIVMQSESDWVKLVEKNGGDEWKAFLSEVQAVAHASFSGLLSGLGSASVPTGVSYATTQSQFKDTGKTIMNADGGVNALMNLANEVSGVSNSRMQNNLNKQTSKVKSEVDSGSTKGSTARMVGRLYDTIGEANTSLNKADIATILEMNRFSSKEANAIADAVVAVANGEQLTKKQEQTLMAYEDNDHVNALFENFNDERAIIGKRNKAMADFSRDIKTGLVVTELKKTTEKAFAPTGEYDVSKKGKAINTETKEEIDIKGVASVRKGELMLDLGDGKTINAKNVSFASENDALIYEAIENLGDNINAETANKLIAKYDGSNAAVFARGMAQAYSYGFYGIDSSELSGRLSLATELTEEQRNYAYGLGTQYRGVKDIADKAKARATNTPGKKGLYYRDKSGNSVSMDDYLKNSNVVLKNDVQKTGLEAMRRLAETLGVRINVFESWQEKGKTYYLNQFGKKVEGNPNGFYDTLTGEIYISLDAGSDFSGTMLFTIAHELTHHMRQWSPEHFTQIAKIVFAQAGFKGDVGALIARKQKIAEAKGNPISYDTAMEEVVADGMETILKDGKVFEFMQELKQQNRTAWEKAKAWFKNLAKFLRKLVVAYSGRTANTVEGRRVAAFAKETLEQIERIWAEGVVSASENYQAAMESVVEANAEAVSSDEIITDGAVVTDSEGTKFSYKSMKHDIAEGQMFEDLKTYCGWTQSQVDELRDNLSDLVEYMAPNRDILDMNETYGREGRRFSPYKPNSDPLYKISMDFSTLCSKRLLTQYVIENLQLRENRPMSPEEQMAIRDMLNEYRKVEQGLQVACAMCYVEAARLKSPKQIQRWLDDPVPHLRNYFALKNTEFNAFVKEKQADFKESRGYARNTPKKDMKQADVTELNKIGPKLRSQYKLSAEEQAIVEKAKTLPNSTYLTAGNLAELSETDPVIYSAYTSFVRTATRSKSLETDEPYYYGDSRRDNGNGIIVSDSFIEAVNRENGMRFSSWSDWRIQHLLDYITAVIDNSVRGAAMHGYTKFGEEVRVLGKTGMMFNMSGVAGTQTGLNENGSLSFSPTESIDVNEAVQLREEFPETAGLQCIGVSDTHIIELLRSDIIDYVIPYHVSGLNAALRRMANIYGWADYTGTQHAAVDKSIKKENAVDPEHWHEEPVFSEFFVGYDTGMSGIEAMRASAEQYKQMCKDRGLTPKFNQFANEANYWKLLIDRKMINHITGEIIEQTAVKPIFDESTIKGVVDRYVDNYDSGLEARALNHIVENWDSIPKRIKDLKKQGNTKAKKTKKAVGTLANQTLAAQPTAKLQMRNAVEETSDLLAYHNITQQLLLDVLNRKGLLMPSLAVTNKGMTDFGEVSLLFDKSTIDPTVNSENKLYGADAWTPTQTQLKKNAKFDTDKTVRTVNHVKNRIGSKYVSSLFNVTAKQFKNAIVNADGSIYDAYAHNIGMQTAYAMEQGIISKIPTNKDGSVNKTALQAQLHRELDTDNGWRQYKKWLNNISDTIITSYDTATNEDILNNMKAQPATAKAFKLSETGELVVPAVEYSSIDEVRKNKNRLSENAAEATKAVANEFLALAKKIGDTKSVVDAINSSFASRYSTADIVKSFNSKGIKISNQTASELQSLYKKAVELPTQYFEAKPGREVGLNEVKAVVMPADASYAELKGKLEAAGITVVEYTAGSKESRVEALNSMDSLKFSERDITEDPLYPDTERERSAFNRMFIDKTNGLKLHKEKDIIITTDLYNYHVRAVGRSYKTKPLLGEILKKVPLDNAISVDEVREEVINGTYRATEEDHIPYEETPYVRRRNDRRTPSLRERLAAEGYDYLLDEPYKGDTEEDRGQGSGNRQSKVKLSDRDSLTPEQQKHFDYNQKQATVGSTLKTLKGSAIKRSTKYGVGKEIGGEIYFHKDYAEDIVPDEVLSQAMQLLEDDNPGFEYNCLKYNPKNGVVAFQEAPDFDSAREPVVGDYVSVNTNTGAVKTGHSNYIWHHKWNWVKNDYSGFDVEESWNWSKEWLSTLTEVSDGNGIARWNAQLDKFGLPHDGVKYSEREQEYDSKDTSIKNLASTFTKFGLKATDRVLDWGGGQYDIAKKAVEHGYPGIKIEVVDAFNRTKSHNDRILKEYADNPATVLTINNVLNVIKETNIIEDVIRESKEYLADDCFCYINIYEGDKTGKGKATPKGWQNNQPAEWYKQFAEKYYKYVERFGEILVASDKPFDRKGVVKADKETAKAMRDKADEIKKTEPSMRESLYSDRVLMGSLFSGGGTLEAGLAYQMLDKEFGVEYDGKIASVYADNHGDHIQVGKVEDFDISKYDDIFYLHASPVCHNFSKAKHGAKELQMDIDSAKATAKHLETAMPQVFTVENAPAYRKSESLKIITNKLTELGYKWDVDVYNSADYGSATSRNRVILRAVKDGELPPKPTKQERTNSWDKVTRDLWNTLPKAELRPSFISAIENTRNLPILDANGKVNVNNPLLILTTTSGHMVTYCWEGDVCPTLTTKCGEARLVMPDGNIYAVTPEFMGRIQGLPDDYKYPKSKTRAFTIIGNGIPTHLTKAVIGGVLDSAYEQTHGGQVLYQDRTEDSVSNRSLLANAFEGIAKPEERQKIQEYKNQVALINAEETKLRDLNEQIKELSFAKGPRDTKKISELREEATKTANRINTLDKRLLRLEAAQPLQDVLEREKKKAYDRATKQGREALAEQRERSDKVFVRRKIQRVVGDLNNLLLREDKKSHVPDSLKRAVADALSLVNMDTVGADERIAKYEALIAKEQNKAYPDQDKIDAYTVTLENIKNQGEKMGQKLKDLRDAYEEIQNSDDPDIANGYDQVISSSLKELAESIGNTSLRKMTIEQLEDVYDMYKMVLTRVRDANKSLIESIKENISSRASAVIGQVKDVGGEHKSRASILDPARTFVWNNLKPVYAMERIGSSALTEAFNNVRSGEDTWAKDVTEARKYYLDKSKQYGYDSWDFDKKYTFKSTSDIEFELTLEQVMALYAYSKRDQAHEHLRLGGFVFDSNIETYKEKDGKKSVLKYKVNTADTHQLTPETLGKIIGTLSSEQKSFVDEMQDYLSNVMGAKGNEVTMKMYGVKLFKEKFYFPLKSAKQFMFEQNEVAGEVRIKNSGFTNKTKPKANNPIILNNFMDVWANHVNDMSMYHSFVLPLEDFNRIFNYASPKKEGVAPVSVKGTLQNAYSPASVSYIKQLITDLNGGAMADPRETFAKAMTAKFKKAKVFSSMSVVIQQPSAIGRAFALVDPKYFRPTMDGMTHEQRWEELKQYAPVAVIKEMGYFDTNMGRSTLDFIKAKEYTTFKEKVKAFFADSGYRDEKMSRLPALADELTWCSIWNAVKRETVAKHNDLRPGSKEFLEEAGKRFTEVVTKTQVYDSVLARSANMRSKSGIMSMVTSFMAEPTTSINMLEDAIIKSKRGNKGYAARAFASVGVSIILNNVLVSLIYAMRDDDEDETILEKYAQAFASNMMDDLNPITYYPYLKDMWSLFQGYDVERADMSLVSDLADSAKGLLQAYVSEDGDVAGAWLDLTGTFANLGGIPMENIRRDINGGINFVKTLIEDVNGRPTTWSSMGDTLLAAVKDSTPVWGWFPDDKKSDKLYDAIVNGDTTYLNRLKSSYTDEDAYHSAVRKALRENDPRIMEAALAGYNGDPSERVRIARLIIKDGFDQDDVVAAINAEINAMKPDEPKGDPKKKGYYTTDDFALEISNGDQASAYAAKEDIIATAMENGKTEEEAKKSFVSSAKTSLKDMVLSGEVTEDGAINALVTYCDMTEDDALADVQYWVFKRNYPDVFADDAWFDKYYEDVADSGISIDVYMEYRNQVKSITGENKKEGRMSVIDSLPISSEQKDALYYAEGWAASKLYEAPWH